MNPASASEVPDTPEPTGLPASDPTRLAATDPIGLPAPAPRRAVAAFDFDGTITSHDTLLPFLRLVAGRARLGLALTRQAPRLALLAVGIGSREAQKERLLTRLLAGHRYERLADLGAEYAGALAEERPFRFETLERIDWHLEREHTLVVITASLDLYVEPLARRMGFHHVIASRLEVDDRGRVTGRLASGNCRGPQKAVRLREWLGAEPVELWAYGDSAGDDELLALADHPVRV